MNLSTPGLPFQSYRLGLIFCSVCIMGVAATAAQPTAITEDSDSSKKSAVAWRLQAQTVAKELGLSKEDGARLAETYVAARKTRQKLLKAIPKTDGDSVTRRQEIDKINTKQREHFKTAMREILSNEQTEKAFMSLGSFNPRWDHYVTTIGEFNLDDEKQTAALRLTTTYIVDYGKARTAAAKAGNRFSSVLARQLKATLDNGLAKLLSEEQLSKWNEATAFRSGGTARSSRGEGKREGKQGGRKNVKTN